MIIPDEIKELIHKYIEKNGKRPLGFNYDEWNSFAEYKKYLEKELEKIGRMPKWKYRHIYLKKKLIVLFD